MLRRTPPTAWTLATRLSALPQAAHAAVVASARAETRRAGTRMMRRRRRQGVAIRGNNVHEDQEVQGLQSGQVAIGCLSELLLPSMSTGEGTYLSQELYNGGEPRGCIGPAPMLRAGRGVVGAAEMGLPSISAAASTTSPVQRPDCSCVDDVAVAAFVFASGFAQTLTSSWATTIGGVAGSPCVARFVLTTMFPTTTTHDDPDTCSL